MIERVLQIDEKKQAGRRTTLVAAVAFAISGFVDSANAVTVRPGCSIDGFGSVYAPGLQVSEDGKHCSAFTKDEMHDVNKGRDQVPGDDGDQVPGDDDGNQIPGDDDGDGDQIPGDV